MYMTCVILNNLEIHMESWSHTLLHGQLLQLRIFVLFQTHVDIEK